MHLEIVGVQGEILRLTVATDIHINLAPIVYRIGDILNLDRSYGGICSQRTHIGMNLIESVARNAVDISRAVR